MKNTEQMIIRSLLTDEIYMRRAIPFLKKEYFETVYGDLFREIVNYTAKYNSLPSQSALEIAVDQSSRITDSKFSEIQQIIPVLFEARKEDLDHLTDVTEKWCQDRALFLSIMKSIEIIEGKDPKNTKDALPSILQEALAVSFDTDIGHDYLENFEERYEYYHRTEERVPFDLEYFNKISNGGLAKKTLSIILAGTGVGKSMFMCHCAATALADGKNVLYITLEMSEEQIAERIDGNLMNIPTKQLDHLSKKMFTDRVKKIASTTTGKLIVKEYPTAQAHSGHFRALLQELSLKKDFQPDLIYVDYLNICASSRIKASDGSYAYIKAIAEELRGLAIEFNLPIMSATQTTRSGYSNEDPGLEDTSESWGLPATADLFLALVSNDELERLGRVLVKQLKNRRGDVNTDKYFHIGVDRTKSKFFDVDQTQDHQVIDDGMPVFDKGSSGEKLSNIKFN